ncbi:Protein PAT-12, isoform e, protein [Aphelenchoides fujianensis]|nr:Protein PAT-12, isoform e, protein [Aphelenchoides fujianensis]
MHRSASQYSAAQEASNFQVVTPLYKTSENVSTQRSVGGGSLADLSRKHAETNGDYKAERTQKSFRMQIIDPKVDTNAYIPAHAQTQFPRHKPLMDDFPSQHGKRSLLKLDAMEQRKIRSTESRPITTNAYLNESLDRHRAMEASKLREHLKAREEDANKAWNKPAWPESNNNEESLRELEQIRKSIETLQKHETFEEFAEFEQTTHPGAQPRPFRYFTSDESASDRMSPSPGQTQKSILKNPQKMSQNSVPPPPPPPPPPSVLSRTQQSTTRLKTRSSEQPLQRPPSVSPGAPTFQSYEERETFHAMQENLRQQRARSQTPQSSRTPVASFNGPFFRLEEVSPSPGFASGGGTSRDFQRPLSSQQYNRAASGQSAASPDYERQLNYGGAGETVVIWPPPGSEEGERPRPASVAPRSITDPERVGVFERQKQMEIEAMRRRDEREQLSQVKQMNATKLQQQRGVSSRAGYHQLAQQPGTPTSHHLNAPDAPSPASSGRETHTPMLGSDPGPTPNLRVFETRPISALSGDSGFPPSWKRTYLVSEPEISARNEILRSEEVLERERFEVDLLQRRDAFIERPEAEPVIQRLGRRWQPPPERPYVWPHASADERAEYQWEPVVGDPAYKHERKNFTPTHSPPHSPRRGRGTRPLDEVAQRQTRNVIQPSPDGSHRPKPAFKTSRATPSGGFVPHAPNAVKVIKKRTLDVQGGPLDRAERDVEVIRENTFHLVNDPTRRRNSDNIEVNDWEKIYDLPPHTSTVVNRDQPANVDVRRRLQLFEHRSRRRSQSAHQSYESYRDAPPLQISTSTTSGHPRSASRGAGGSLLKTASPISNEPKKHDDLDELARKNRELAERSRSRRQEFKIVESEITRTEPEPIPPPLKDVSSATWQYNSSSFSPRSVVSVNGAQEGLLKIRTSQSVANILEIETKPWPHMPANLRPVADSPQSTMTREMNETYARRINRYNSMPALETASSRGTLIKLQEEKPRSIMKVRESHEIISASKPKVTETVQRVEERKRTEEIERRVLRRERRHKSHRSRYGHSSHAHQEALGWHGGGGGSSYHRSSSMNRGGGGGGYDAGYYHQYPPAPPQHNGYTSHHNVYYDHNPRYEFPPAYPRRTASAMLYH